MNKKFTMVCASLLLASAFSASYAAPVTAELPAIEVTDGFKFFYGDNAATSLLQVKKVTLENKQVIWTIADATTALDEAKSAKFEIRNMRKSGNNVLFELWANGNKIYVTNEGKAVADGANVALTSLYSDFYAANTNTPNKFTGDEVKSIKVFVPGANVAFGGNTAEAYVGSTSKEEYDQTDFKEYNGNVDLKAFSFSFNTETEKVEGNVFTDMVAVDSKTTGKVLFVKGDAKQIQKFIDASSDSYDFAETGKSLQFVAIQTDATYNINALKDKEGKKLVVVTGEALAKAAANKYVSEFAVTESDRLNAEGELTLGATIGSTNVLVGAVRPSATDNTTYVTTMLETGSEFNYIPATLGNNEYLDASILLKKNAQNVVSIYFTSGKPETGEYHKYLTAGSKIKSYSESDPTLPENQWIVAGFNGKYEFTLVNRATKESIILTLTKGGAEGGYKVSGLGEIDGLTKPAEVSAKFLSITTTKTDGYLSLTEEQIKEGVRLSFTGKTEVTGEKTFYAVEENNTLNPSVTNTDAKKLVPELYQKTDNTDNKDKFLFDTTDYAYLNDKGEVAIAQDKDTLFIPAYHFVTEVKADGTKLYLNNYQTNQNTKGVYALVKNAAGKYSLAIANDNDDFNTLNNANITTVNQNLVFAGVSSSSLSADDLNSKFANVNILSGAELNMSLPAQQGHFTFDNERGSISMTDIKGINEGALATEGMVFWLDSVDTENTEKPAFYISRGIEGNETARMYMYNTIDSAKVFDEVSAKYTYNDVYFYGEDAKEGANAELKVAFTAATEEAGKDLADQFKFNITLKDATVADEYILSSVKKVSLPAVGENKQVYVAQKNGVVILTTVKDDAMAFTLNAASAPTSNEGVSTSEVKVVANNGSVVVKNAAGKNVVVSTILGQVVANEVLTSDNATINVPAGIVVVSVDGESFKVNVR